VYEDVINPTKMSHQPISFRWKCEDVIDPTKTGYRPIMIFLLSSMDLQRLVSGGSVKM
jgi:hypothetical protein